MRTSPLKRLYEYSERIWPGARQRLRRDSAFARVARSGEAAQPGTLEAERGGASSGRLAGVSTVHCETPPCCMYCRGGGAKWHARLSRRDMGPERGARGRFREIRRGSQGRLVQIQKKWRSHRDVVGLARCSWAPRQAVLARRPAKREKRGLADCQLPPTVFRCASTLDRSRTQISCSVDTPDAGHYWSVKSHPTVGAQVDPAAAIATPHDDLGPDPYVTASGEVAGGGCRAQSHRRHVGDAGGLRRSGGRG